jgi:hypothetical protein
VLPKKGKALSSIPEPKNNKRKKIPRDLLLHREAQSLRSRNQQDHSPWKVRENLFRPLFYLLDVPRLRIV